MIIIMYFSVLYVFLSMSYILIYLIFKQFFYRYYYFFQFIDKDNDVQIS